jgi:calcineurin-like phosphoesterase family protein
MAIIESIKKLFMGEKKTFLISDLHFGHEMTLLFVPRPFNSTHEMNVALVSNWNDAVRRDDLIWHLGDLNWTQRPGFWINKLSGKKLFIRGNHDRSKWMKRYAAIKRGRYSFFLVHDPDDRNVPKGFTGWVIHGHHHGGRDKFGNEYPFIDGVKKRINVVCELTDYKPVDLDWLVGLNLAAIKRMDTVSARPILWSSPPQNTILPQNSPATPAITQPSSKPPDDRPRKELAKIVSQYGKEIVANPQRCEGLLRDTCGDYEREIFILTSVHKKHIPEDLLSQISSVPKDILIHRLAGKISNEFGFTEDFAVWAIITWALALSLITPADAEFIESRKA